MNLKLGWASVLRRIAKLVKHIQKGQTMAELWIHGHTHDSMGYELNDCRVVCNPRGYALTRDGKSIENASFDAGLSIDL